MLKFLLILLMVISLVGCGSGGGGFSSGSLFDSDSSGTSSVGTSTVELASDYSTDSPAVPSYPNPEPSTIMLFGIGIGGLLAAKLRKKKRN